MAFQMTDSNSVPVAQAVLERILSEYLRTSAGGLSRLMERELHLPVTESAENIFRFNGFHYIDVAIDEFLEGIPVYFSATIGESPRGGSEVFLMCQTNLDEPDYAYWEFRDYLKGLSEGGCIGTFRMHEGSPGGSPGDDKPVSSLRYEYRFPVPDDGDISSAVIGSVVTRFLDDVFHAATKYFGMFFYHRPSHPHQDKIDDTSGSGRSKNNGTSRVIPFPLNRRNRSR
jgi:hypothetical protein